MRAPRFAKLRAPCSILHAQRCRRRPSLTSDLRPLTSGFTLVELMVVIGIIAILMALIVPAFTNLKSAGDVLSAADTIKGVLEQARNYAMANNTYAWVGFYEEAATASTPTTSSPPYPGVGQVILGTVYSIDGTAIYDDNASSALLPAAQVRPLGKVVKVNGIHLVDIGAPPSPTPSPTPSANSLAGRPNVPYTEGSPFDHFNRISSESSDATKFGFVSQGYTFSKTIRFNPRGEANINSTYTMKHAGEIALRPTHGTAVDTVTTNVGAIQFGGTDGNFRIYRK
jgi:prepilin-type N-terminal cleavage/methylation domain-containing protein